MALAAIIPALTRAAGASAAAVGGRAAVTETAAAADSGMLGNALGGGAFGQNVESMAGQMVGQKVLGGLSNPGAGIRSRLAAVENATRSPNSLGVTGIDAWFPAFGHTILVAVEGGPGADINRIWKLAVAAAFGRFRQRISTFAGATVDCVWDITDKAVAIRISYASNGLVPHIAGAIAEGKRALNVIQEGPSAETVGGTWADFLQTWPQIFAGAKFNGQVLGGKAVPRQAANAVGDPNPAVLNIGIPLDREAIEDFAIGNPAFMPDDGRVITTAYKTDPHVQPPRPPDDANLLALVSNALTSPCYLPAGPPETMQVTSQSGPRGYYIYPPGSDPGRRTVMSRITFFLKRDFDRVLAAALGRGVPRTKSLDGYPVVTKAVPNVIDETPVNSHQR